MSDLKRLGLLAWILGLGFLILGCSKKIRPVDNSFYRQKAFHEKRLGEKPVYSARTWREIAVRVAEKAAFKIQKKGLASGNSVYVLPGQSTPFAKSFRKLLLTELVKRNVLVSDRQSNHLILAFEHEFIRHEVIGFKAKENKHPSRDWTNCECPMCEEIDQDKTDFSKENRVQVFELTNSHESSYAEVLLTVSLSRQGHYYFRDSAIFAVPFEEWEHYQLDAQLENDQLKTYGIVDKDRQAAE